MVSSSAQALAVTEDDEPRVEPRQGGFTGTYRLLVRGKNINQNTLLATDYLNHFNEIIMLLGMVPSMPECYRDAVEWRPKSYAQHFRDSRPEERRVGKECVSTCRSWRAPDH